ncbi:MAG: hypothetical protein ABUL50_04490 [Rhizobacter sp.]
MKASSTPERWSADSGHRDVARLDIPADAQRERQFEIFCHLVVGNKAGRVDATHGLRVLVNGALEWARTVPTQADGTDSLDLRLRRSVPVGHPLRVTATCELKGAQRISLTITADED